MRVSNIGDFLGGADNVSALEMIQGEQRIFAGSVVDSDDAITDITDFTITAKAEFYTATVGSTSRAITVSDLTLLTDPVSKDLTVNKTDNANGEFELVLPSDLYENNIDADIASNVPLAVVYIQYNDGADTETIRFSRLLIVIRRSIT